MRVLTVIGARPQFVKAAVVSRALAESGVEEVLVHTGQHYDAKMSDVFFDELGIPEPRYNLGVGSGPHGQQTGRMLADIESVLIEERPDVVVVYGDTNSTIAGALAAAKLLIPVAHIEAGLRSFDRRMPEEVNRCVTDHLSTWHFCPTDNAVENLRREGITENVFQVGDVMCDATLLYGSAAGTATPADDRFAVCTIHRAGNTDDETRFRGIWAGINELAEEIRVVLPLHPRTKGVVERLGLAAHERLEIVEPVGYREMLGLLRGSSLVMTDSGGMQKEAYVLGVPCVTLRDETEWTETVDAGWNRLAGADRAAIVAIARGYLGTGGPAEHPSLYGDGHASERIVEVLRAA